MRECISLHLRDQCSSQITTTGATEKLYSWAVNKLLSYSSYLYLINNLELFRLCYDFYNSQFISSNLV
uniref:Uncharacterized protein n=1 Tax=Trichobilharzia regenti TaxID=157069 RepID=A0AA85KL06_TRIRE|nr:unnamed protein product [Trichobilharzia regenti]